MLTYGLITFPRAEEMDAEVLERLRDLCVAMELYVDPRYPPPIVHGPAIM